MENKSFIIDKNNGFCLYFDKNEIEQIMSINKIDDINQWSIVVRREKSRDKYYKYVFHKGLLSIYAKLHGNKVIVVNIKLSEFLYKLNFT